MSRELTKMNLIAIVQQLPEEDIEVIETYIKMIEDENQQLQDNWNELKNYAKENLYFYSGYQGEDLELDLSIKYLLDEMEQLEKRRGR